jgi:hypothetical protein
MEFCCVWALGFRVLVLRGFRVIPNPAPTYSQLPNKTLKQAMLALLQIFLFKHSPKSLGP